MLIQSFWHTVPTNEGTFDPLRMIYIVKPVTTLNAQPPMIRWAISAGHVLNAVILNVISKKASHTAVWADRIYSSVHDLEADAPGRPRLYGTTQFFLEHFGLKGLGELPAADELRRIQVELATVPADDSQEELPLDKKTDEADDDPDETDDEDDE